MKLMFAILLASCAFAGDKAAVAAACGPDSVRFDVSKGAPPQSLPKADAGKALVYVIEDTGNATYPITSRVGLDGAWVGANHGDSWLSFPVEPGERHLCADWQPGVANSGFSAAKLISLVHINAEAGKVYYFRVQFGEPMVGLEEIDSDEGRLLIASYPFSISHPKK